MGCAEVDESVNVNSSLLKKDILFNMESEKQHRTYQ